MCTYGAVYLPAIYFSPRRCRWEGTVSMVCINLRLTQLCVCLLRNRPVQFSRNRRGGGGTPRRGEGPTRATCPLGSLGSGSCHIQWISQCAIAMETVCGIRPLNLYRRRPPPNFRSRPTAKSAWLALGQGKLKNKVTYTPRKVLCYGTVPSPPNSNYQHLSVTACHVRWPFSSRCRHRGSRALGKAKKLTWLGLGLEG